MQREIFCPWGRRLVRLAVAADDNVHGVTVASIRRVCLGYLSCGLHRAGTKRREGIESMYTFSKTWIFL